MLVRTSVLLVCLASLCSGDLLSDKNPTFKWPQLQWQQETGPAPSQVYGNLESTAKVAEGAEKLAKRTLLDEVSKPTLNEVRASKRGSEFPSGVEKKLSAARNTIEHVLTEIDHLSKEVKKEEVKSESAKLQEPKSSKPKLAVVVKKVSARTKAAESKIPLAKVLSANQVLVRIPKQRQAGGLFAFEVPGRGMFVTHTTPGSSKAEWLRVDLNEGNPKARTVTGKKVALKQHGLQALVASKSSKAMDWFRVVIPTDVKNGIFQTMVQGHGPVLVKVPHGMVPGQTVVMKLPVRQFATASTAAKLSAKGPSKMEQLQSNTSTQQEEIDWNQKGDEKKDFFNTFQAPQTESENVLPKVEAVGAKKVDYAWPKPGYMFPGMDKDSGKKKIVWPGEKSSKVEWPDHIGEPAPPLLETPSKKLQPDWFKPFAEPAQGSQEDPAKAKNGGFSFAFSNPLSAAEEKPAEKEGEKSPSHESSEGKTEERHPSSLMPVVINWPLITAGTAIVVLVCVGCMIINSCRNTHYDSMENNRRRHYDEQLGLHEKDLMESGEDGHPFFYRQVVEDHRRNELNAHAPDSGRIPGSVYNPHSYV